MALDTTTPRTRRAMLAAGFSGLVAAVVGSIARPAAVRAATGDPVLIASSNYETGTTDIHNVGTDSGGLSVEASGTGTGVYATSPSGTGVYATGAVAGVYGGSSAGYGLSGEVYSGRAVRGLSNGPGYGVSGETSEGIGVYGHSDSGIGLIADSNAIDQAAAIARSVGNSTALVAYSGSHAAPAPQANTGVFGYAVQDSTARGVYGKSTAGEGVRGQATSGVGVYATASSTGFALQAAGRVKLSRSGQVNIGAGKTYVDVTVAAGLAGTPLPFATLLRYHSGVYVAAIRPNYPTTGVMRIYLNQAASATASTPVSWLVLG